MQEEFSFIPYKPLASIDICQILYCLGLGFSVGLRASRGLEVHSLRGYKVRPSDHELQSTDSLSRGFLHFWGIKGWDFLKLPMS